MTAQQLQTGLVTMFYTKVGSFIAAAIFTLAVFQIVMGLGLATSENTPEVIARLLGTRTTGQAIDRGIYGVILGVALGILTEISRNVRGYGEKASISSD